jgi:branched-chain amino acid transport system ATP-binding protein
VTASVLAVDAIDVFIQTSHILRSVSLEVGRDEVVCLVGRNGAGKTTTLRTIMGYLRPRAGRVALDGQPIHGLRTHEIALRGIGFAPEEGGIFADLTVAENIEIATWTRPTARPAAERIAQAYEVFPKLRGYAARGGAQLSGGERRMLSIARALALDPELLLLDEPFEGLAPAIIPSITDSIAAIAQTLGRAILIAESNIHHVPEYARRLYVIERGEIVFAGPPTDARRDRSLARIIGGTA